MRELTQEERERFLPDTPEEHRADWHYVGIITGKELCDMYADCPLLMKEDPDDATT